MRVTFVSTLLVAVGFTHAAVNVTKTETVDLVAGEGDLGWGASGLAYGYSAGCGLNFASGKEDLQNSFSYEHKLQAMCCVLAI